MRWIIHPDVRAEVRALEFCGELLAQFDTSLLETSAELETRISQTLAGAWREWAGAQAAVGDRRREA